MKKQIFASGFFLFCLISPQKALAANFSQIYAFGDSLTDTGNAFIGSQGQIPVSPAYFNGRFSNGPVWVDYFGEQVGDLEPKPSLPFLLNPSLPLPQEGINFAVGGAQTGISSPFPGISDIPIPGVLGQVAAFTQIVPDAGPNAIYSIWGGANDYFQGDIMVDTVVGNLSQSVGLLVNKGAKNIAVSNLPDLGLVPFAGILGRRQDLSRVTREHNRKLEIALNGIQAANPGVNIYRVDINSLFERITAEPNRFGLTNVEDTCVKGNFQNVTSICPNPNEIAFYDNVHPNTKVHNLIALKTLATIEGKSIPEPSLAVGILGLGVLSLAGGLKRVRS